mmetsp:Transcript_58779/g.191724  ORF Transcript_58779/g.191724 Transcript_58779/m.191724 type:complete len:231 (+) Transcript_58779:732-1424(+)
MALCTFEGMSGLDSGVGSLTCLACKGVRLLLRGLLNLIALLAHSLCLVVTGRVLDILRRAVSLFGGGNDLLGAPAAARLRKCAETALEGTLGILGALLDVLLRGLLDACRGRLSIRVIVEKVDKGLEFLDGVVGVFQGLLACLGGARQSLLGQLLLARLGRRGGLLLGRLRRVLGRLRRVCRRGRGLREAGQVEHRDQGDGEDEASHDASPVRHDGKKGVERATLASAGT